MKYSLEFRGGRKALEQIKDEGLKTEKIKILAGASGGPKWLVLAGIDRVLPGIFRERKDPLRIIASSIGAWRASALAQKDPGGALASFRENYIAQSYTKKPTPGEVTDESMKILNAFLPDEAMDYLLNHPFYRINMIAARSRAVGASDSRLSLLPFLTCAALCNLAWRPSLNMYFQRVLFHDRREGSLFSDPPGFKSIRAPLTAANYKKAVMATGAIPMVMSGIRNIEGTPPGTYRDGGIIDYHLDIPFPAAGDEIVLYPHFYGKIIPGWLDKNVPWRKASQSNTDSILLVSPSKDFVSSLPMGKIPDRKDFHLFKGSDRERMNYWNTVADRSNELGQDLVEALNSGNIRQRIKPLF